jgi:hypothetical protein
MTERQRLARLIWEFVRLAGGNPPASFRTRLEKTSLETLRAIIDSGAVHIPFPRKVVAL